VRYGPTQTLAKLALIVVLAFQLVIGSVSQAMPQGSARGSAMARASAVERASAVSPASAAAAAAEANTARAGCPMHDSVPQGTNGKHSPGAQHGPGSQHMSDNQLGAGGHHGSGEHGSGGHHDCCQASACQCHYVQTPAAIDVMALNQLTASAAIPSRSTAQFVPPRIDEFLRPPIA
jgi:hypothetical protein